MRRALVLPMALAFACAARAPTPADSGAPPLPDGGQMRGKTSGGSGGVPCESEGTLSGMGRWCGKKLGNVEYRVIVPRARTTPPYRLAVYFHGDNPAQYRDNGALEGSQFWIADRHVLFVSIRAPNGCSWWQSPGGCDGDRDLAHEAASAARAVIEELRGYYDIRSDGYLFVANSGGGIFTMSSFFPRHADDYPGAYVILCGGGTPWDGQPSWTLPAIDDSRLYFTYGDGDFLLGTIRESVAYWKGSGVPLAEEVLPGQGHCTFNLANAAQRAWEDYLGRK